MNIVNKIRWLFALAFIISVLIYVGFYSNIHGDYVHMIIMEKDIHFEIKVGRTGNAILIDDDGSRALRRPVKSKQLKSIWDLSDKLFLSEKSSFALGDDVEEDPCVIKISINGQMKTFTFSKQSQETPAPEYCKDLLGELNGIIAW